MIGAIIGDVVGSRFEFNNIKTKEFELIAEESEFTDDTVLTIAVMDWLLHAERKCSTTAVEYLQKWARKYPHAGYRRPAAPHIEASTRLQLLPLQQG